MRLADYLNKKITELAGGVSNYNGDQEEERLIFINNRREIMEEKLKEYDTWYQGDSDELLNFYTVQTNINYNYEPFYSRNKRGYFWSIASTEGDIKRTHSGQPRNIVDTMVSLIGKPQIKVGMEENPIAMSDNILRSVLEDNEFWDLYEFEQMPMTLVEGWGCWKIDWDKDISDYPLIKYYRAKDVEFVYRDKRLGSLIFKDYYTDGKFNNYLVTETRTVLKGNLYIYKEVFRFSDEESIEPLTAYEVSQIEGLEQIELETVVIDNYKKFLAVPCVFYKDTVNNDGYGRSVFTGKIDLFDDLDQCLSQAANTVRRSTPVEYFNTDFLERDANNLPKMPHVYDRKYTSFIGGRTVDGTSNSTQPVQVTQPQLVFNEYNTEAQQILLHIISGFMSPATLGIDLAKKDNADAQREKEKVTIFTRNVLIGAEMRILENLFNQVLCAVQLMKQGKVTTQDYGISIKYSEFADDSFENKLQKLGEAYVKGTLSTDMYLNKLYGESLSESELAKEKEYLESKSEEADNPFAGGAVGGAEEDEEFDFGDEKPGFKGENY